jgi:hypothetical protein
MMKPLTLTWITILLLLLTNACSHSTPRISGQGMIEDGEDETEMPTLGVKATYNLNDNSGKFSMVRESAYKAATHEWIIKKKIYDPAIGESRPLETSVLISSVGTLKEKYKVLRPKISQYTVWFEGKEFFNEMKINIAKRAMDLTFRSPETQWNGTKQIPFPPANGPFCYFGQLAECMKIIGFTGRAIEKKSGKLHLNIIWEGYPYFQEQYSNIPNELFTPATLEYDGVLDSRHEHRFILDIGNQSLFLVLNRESELLKMFWVAQGLSIVANVPKQKGEKQKLTPRSKSPTADNLGGKLNRDGRE